MSDSDLLRRGDVKAVVREAFSHKPHPHLDLRYQEALAAIDAVPAAADGRWEIEILPPTQAEWDFALNDFGGDGA